ncbi:MAG: hypothetical protein R2827_12915 [Bdellovibrionales bacterium]
MKTTNDNNLAPDRILMTSKVIWFALLGAIFLYGIICHITLQGKDILPLEKRLLFGVSVMALTNFIVLILVDRKLFSWDQLIVFAKKNISHQGNFEDSQWPLSLARQLLVRRILLWALSESIAIYGLTLAFVSANINYYFPFALVAMLSLIFYRPKEEEFNKLLNLSKRTSAMSSN